MYKKIFFMFLIIFVLSLMPVHRVSANDDNFLYGVQIFNYPIDWNGGKYSELVPEMVNRAADMDFDIVRGGSQFSSMYSQVKRDAQHNIKSKNLKLNWVITGVDSKLGMTNPPDINDWEELTGLGGVSLLRFKISPK